MLQQTVGTGGSTTSYVWLAPISVTLAVTDVGFLEGGFGYLIYEKTQKKKELCTCTT